jgi:hypothetical protein
MGFCAGRSLRVSLQTGSEGWRCGIAGQTGERKVDYRIKIQLRREQNGVVLVLGIKSEFHLRLGLVVCGDIFPFLDSRACGFDQNRIASEGRNRINRALWRNDDLEPYDAADVRFAQSKRIARSFFVDQLPRRLSLCVRGQGRCQEKAEA